MSIVAKITRLPSKAADAKPTQATKDSKLSTAVILFDQPMKEEVGELQSIERSFSVQVGSDGNRINWRVTAVKGGVFGTADDTSPVQKIVFNGNTGVVLITFRSLTAQKQYGVILHEGFLPVSNTQRFTLSDFKLGDASREYDTLVAGLPKPRDK